MPRQLQPTIPIDLETICLTCLQKNPAARYASAEALGEDLRRFLDDEPILALPTPLSDRVLSFTRRRPATALALTAGALLAGSLLHAWGDLTFTLRNDRDQARAQHEQAVAQLHDARGTIERLAAAAQACQRLGELHRQLGDIPAAVADYRQAIELYVELDRQFPNRQAYSLRLQECQQQLQRLQAVPE